MKKNHPHYFSVGVLPTLPRIEFSDLKEMHRYVDTFDVNPVFTADLDGNGHNAFAIFKDACMFFCRSQGFKTLEDFRLATEKGFPDASVFYQAQSEGYTKYNDYLMVKEAGVSDAVIIETMKKKGFIAGFSILAKRLEENPDSLPADLRFKHAYELYCFAQKQRFDDFESMMDAMSKGFMEKSLYVAAKALGFTCFSDYEDAAKRGFRDNEVLKFANENNIKDAADLKLYKDLEALNKDNLAHDLRLMLILLSKIEQGKKVSLNKLSGLLNKETATYKNPESGELPGWFKVAISSIEHLDEFLHKNDSVKRYGHYDAEGEVFEINQMKDRAIVLDASNVAHASNGKTDKKVLAENLLLMVRFLKSKGFHEISAIADASLRHKISDPENLETLKEEIEYLEAPRESSADQFLLDYVKSHHCLIVSNDTFREWKVQLPWVAENIDYYRISFMIKDKNVIMPDLN